MKRRAIAVSTAIALALIIPVTHNVGVRVEMLPKQHHPVKTKATMDEKRANKIMAMRYAKAGWNWDKQQRRCIYSLFTKESRFDHLAKNQQGSSAYGIGQVLKESSSDPAIQILNAYKYIKHRYGTPCRAWKHSQHRNWY